MLHGMIFFMKIIPLIVGQLKTNCYLVEASGNVGIIDPGDDGEYIIDQIAKLNLKPFWVAATHGHFDHVLAVSEIALTCKIPFYIHPKDLFLLKQAKNSAEHFTAVKADPLLVEPFPFPEEKTLSLGEEKLEVIETPGHTPGGVCLYSKKDHLLVCGDLLFAGGIVGRTDLRYASFSQLAKSVKKILKLAGRTMVYPGHGGDTTVEELKAQLPETFV
ncbi:MAG: Metallo-beta-lactamase family protein [Candidatus Daviesbacteria bacterium GW2011_GWA1_41_61]|uniref:Metallo-beta-lactamase family protein n=1 Tax=Candidatus Daviesbacteria bacterium GW2011_GWA2_40_9 TaxID=1618424 RepID=A0A0G0X7B8_9BACT|nr:MAG: Metallo-beta-lactamase family protein [Candidatus Daviesbacteria bacterium GW2011_GWC1_40_9]KKR83532.1 MAG: Metallo-beta-lactamase family protein [Candidatus Daviesbacteria bacterium GW2011_GWA2_40_9]KKR93100.1 MAG: Metallo-beta-lactamase family protein [Candidatus Daviesbacteria bacterium GW2011_GWB1_41_15]KKS15644.1 MAG: Metallo-beta-lactamase family protein [Candidatus Daviesbacteria bacterium GW2011_GWA1_41_61]